MKFQCAFYSCPFMKETGKAIEWWFLSNCKWLHTTAQGGGMCSMIEFVMMRNVEQPCVITVLVFPASSMSN